MKFRIKQHLIYFSIMLLVIILLNEGYFIVISAFFVYIKRFPRTYFVYFSFGILAFWWLNQALFVFSHQIPINSEKYVANVIEIKKQNEERQVAIIEIAGVRVYLNTAESEPKLVPGDIIEVEGSLKEPSKPTIPHQFDFKGYLKQHKIGLTLYGSNLIIKDNHWSIRRYQYDIANYINTRYPSLTATYLNSFLFGVRDGLSEEVETAYKNLGVFHLFAISGLHVNLLVSLIRLTLKRIGIIHELINAIIIIFLLGFIIITGGTPSIVRAGLMSILAIINRNYKMNFSSLDILSIVFIGNFIVNPTQVFQLGFIFSYWITFILISSQSFLKELTPLKRAIFIPFLAQISALPIQLATSYEFNLFSYVSNLFIIPLVTTVLIPLLIMSLIIPGLSLLLNKILLGFESLNIWSGNWLYTTYISGSLSFTMITFLLLLVLITCWHYEKMRKPWIWLFAVIAFFTILESQRLFQLESKLTFLDVGQGDGMVIQSSFQRCTIVVDTGGEFNFRGESKSIFSKTLEVYLTGEGVRKIDYLILTHGDYDHIGEAIPLLNHFSVKKLLIAAGEPEGLLSDIIQVAKERGTEVLRVKAGDWITCSNQKLTFLHPKDNNSYENEDSLVATLEMEGFIAMLTADIGSTEESQVLESYNLDRLDVYKVAHHGSKFSNSKSFIEILQPRYAIVSSGRGNIYGHPSGEVVEILDELNIPLLSTQEYGTIQFRISKKRNSVYSFPLN